MTAGDWQNGEQLEASAETVTDADALRAMSYPIRMRILAVLRVESKQTVGNISKKLGVPSGVISYHLGQLEKAGLAHRVESIDGDRRKSWWQASQSGVRLGFTNSTGFTNHSENQETDDAVQAADMFRRSAALSYEMAFERFLDAVPYFSEEWAEACTSDDHVLCLTAQETKQLAQELNEVIQRWQHDTANRPINRNDNRGREEEDAQRIAVIMQIFRWVP